MAHYYATIQGNRGPKTCMGSKSSGIHAAAQTWDGSVIVRIDNHKDGIDTVTIGIGQGSTACIDRTLLTLPLAELMTAQGIWPMHTAHIVSPEE